MLTKKIERPLNFFDYKHLRFIGKDKLLMEYKTAQRIGAKTISFKPAEEDNRLLKAITVLEYLLMLGMQLNR